MALFKHLKALFIFSLFLQMVANKVHSQDVTSFVFDSFVANPTNLTYQGDAHVPSGSTFLRLLRGNYSTVPYSIVGRVLYSSPVQFWQRSSARQATFETTIRFVVAPNTWGAVDGLAFFIRPVNASTPSDSTGGNLGIFGVGGAAASVFAVEFDTHANEWDPSYRHIGIDINSIVSRETAPFDSATGGMVTARINYNPNTRSITVDASSGSQSAALSYVFDLKTVLPEQVQVGISTARGLDTQAGGTFDLHSWYFTSSLVQDTVVEYLRQPL